MLCKTIYSLNNHDRNLTVTCSEMQRGRFTTSHIFSVHINRIHQSLHPWYVPIATGLEKLPKGSTGPTAAASRAGAAWIRTGATAANASCGGASRTATAQGRSREVGGDRSYLRINDTLLLGPWHRRCCRRSGHWGWSRRSERMWSVSRWGWKVWLLLLGWATRRRHFHQSL